MNLSKIFSTLLTKTDDLDIIINSLLVLGGIRKSFLMQPIDIKYKKSEEHFDNMINIIKNTFSNFKFVKIDQGTLITKKETTVPFKLDNYSSKELGEFLSYPCAGDIEKDRNYSFHIMIKYKNKEDSIGDMICKDKNNPKIMEFVNQIKNFIANIDKNLELEYIIKKIYTINDLINSIREYKLNNEIKDEVLNILANFSYGLLYILHLNNKIDIFNKKYKDFLVIILYDCKTASETPNYLTVEMSRTEKHRIYELMIIKKMDYVSNILRDIFDILITEEYMQMAYKMYIP